MPALKSIRDVLERMEKNWFAEKPPFSEKVIEAVLLTELFRGSLGFDERSAKHSQPVARGKKGEVDILLRLPQRMFVIVEVKRPEELLNDRGRRVASKQAARYVRDMGQEYGVVTDGFCWFYFRVVHSNQFYKVHPLIRFDIRSHKQIALRMLERSHRRTLERFLEVLTAIQCHMTRKMFNDLMNLGHEERVNRLVKMAEEQRLKVASADKKIIGMLFSADHAGDLISPSIHHSKRSLLHHEIAT